MVVVLPDHTHLRFGTHMKVVSINDIPLIKRKMFIIQSAAMCLF